MIRAAICDDDDSICSQMRGIVDTAFSEHGISCTITCCSSGCELLKVHCEQQFDIVFLDIIMPDQDGFETARQLRMLSPYTLLLFVTSQEQLVYDSFSYHPFYFLRKGSSNTFQESLSDAVEKIIVYLKQHSVISLKLSPGHYQNYQVQDFLYLKSHLHYVNYYQTNGNYFPVRQTISEAEEQLSPYGFLRIHKQYLINMSKIRRLDIAQLYQVELINGEILAIGRNYGKEVMRAYQAYMRSRL